MERWTDLHKTAADARTERWCIASQHASFRSPGASFRGLREHVLAEFRHDLLGHELHRLGAPRLRSARPVEAGHQQRAERPDLVAEGDKLVEHGLGRAVEDAAFGDGLGGRLLVGHVRVGLEDRE